MKQYKAFIFYVLNGILFLVCFSYCIKEKPEEQELGYLNVNPLDLPDLYQLGYRGETNLIKQLIKEQPEQMADPENQRECLIGAICGERKELVKYLLHKNKNVDLDNDSEAEWGYLRYPNSPFFYALNTGNKDIIALLVKYGANVNGVNPHDMSPLSQAVENGDIASVRFLLKKGAQVNTGTFSPLYQAFERKDREMIHLLLNYGADVNYGPNTCLCLCIKMKDIEFVRFLLEKGADVNQQGQGGWTPLQLAVDYGQTEMIKLFIEHGACINAKVKHYTYGILTPLWLAVYSGNMNTVSFLLEQGVVEQETPSLLLAATLSGNPELFDFFLNKMPEPTHWDSIWEAALEEDNEYVVRYIIDRCSINLNKRLGKFNFLPLEIVARNRYSEINRRIFCYLLEKGAQPELVGTNDPYAHDTMDWIMKNSNPETFDYFLELGFPFEEYTDSNYVFTRLIHVMDYHYFHAARHLIKQAGNKPSVYTSHWSPPILHYATMTYEDPFPILEFLVKEKVDTSFYTAAFLRCVRYNDLESTHLFLQNGVDVNVKNKEGQNALWYVCDPKMAEYLIKRGIDVSIPLIQEGKLIDMNVLSVFVKWGIPIRLTQQELNKALQVAARLGDDKMVDYFLHKGAHINALGEKTPLMENASKGYEICSSDKYRKVSPKVIKQLIKAGADIEAEDKEGNTALMHALGDYTCKDHKCRSRYAWDRQLYHGGLRFPDQDRSLIVMELLKAGANVNKENNKRETPLTLAVKNGYTNLIPILKQYGAK